MRALLAALALVALSACTEPCQELANRLCECSGGGSARDACQRGAEDRLSTVGAGDAKQKQCDAWLGTCHAPDGAKFCEWITTTDAKVACGISLEAPATTP
ncbi:hypothetical protein [Anaeromyxobacter terrae]|uniref:hypothetical protein n=1 Tax=Anaeromyxobacter terrae TaxID=2925406 RepID=UPI001F58C4D0|nr:hypothetical protein [Anaeromyxobacter sp. SG22]